MLGENEAAEQMDLRLRRASLRRDEQTGGYYLHLFARAASTSTGITRGCRKFERDPPAPGSTAASTASGSTSPPAVQGPDAAATMDEPCPPPPSRPTGSAAAINPRYTRSTALAAVADCYPATMSVGEIVIRTKKDRAVEPDQLLPAFNFSLLYEVGRRANEHGRGDADGARGEVLRARDVGLREPRRAATAYVLRRDVELASARPRLAALLLLRPAQRGFTLRPGARARGGRVPEDSERQDRSSPAGRTRMGRDGCRVPIP